MKYYLLIVEGDIEPFLIGAFRTAAERDCRAFKEKRKRGDEDGIFMLNVPDRGHPKVDAYSGGFMDGMWGDPCKKIGILTKKRK